MNYDPNNPRAVYTESFRAYLNATGGGVLVLADRANDMVNAAWHKMSPKERERFRRVPDHEPFADEHEYKRAVDDFVRELQIVAHREQLYGFPEAPWGDASGLDRAHKTAQDEVEEEG